MIFNFYAKDKENWHKTKELLREALTFSFSGTKSFSVKIADADRTLPQLRGFYRQCTMLAPYLVDSFGVLMDKEMVKEFIKQECGYCVMVKGRVITKSLAKANRNELSRMLESLQEVGDFYGIKDFELTPYELREMNKYFERK